jgi:ammonia channel protein AmtB
VINSGDTAWVLIATALVFFMMPGLAVFYGGLVGQKNVVATMAQSFVAIGIVSLLWVVVGYSLAFGSDHAGVIGGFGNVMLRGVGAAQTSLAPHIPALLFMAFQMMFAVSGSVVHELAGATAMAAVLYLGRRQRIDKPHIVPFVLLGGGSLFRFVRIQRGQCWQRWFGSRRCPRQHATGRVLRHAGLDGH